MGNPRDYQKYHDQWKTKTWKSHLFKDKGEYIAENSGPASSCGRHKQC